MERVYIHVLVFTRLNLHVIVCQWGRKQVPTTY